MQQTLTELIECPLCRSHSFTTTVDESNEREIRKGSLQCASCSFSYSVHDGIANLLPRPDEVVKIEQEAHKKNDFLSTGIGSDFSESIVQYRSSFLSLPEGDDSQLFKKPGYFRNVSTGAQVFYDSIKKAGLKEHSLILECGADTCWASAKLSEWGHRCIATDINHHLIASDIYMEEKNLYFERILADMNNLPFKESVFDAVITIASFHHTGDIRKTLSGFHRVLKKGGLALIISEPVNSIFTPWRKKAFGGYEKEIGINEQTYTFLEYRNAAFHTGFHFNARIVGFEHYFKKGSTLKKAVCMALSNPLSGKLTESLLFYIKPFNMVMLCRKV